MNILVVGAGAFGGWTALELQRLGANVTLVDAWGPGHSRSSSGGETRAIRAVYGADELYVEMVARARTLWQRAEREWNVRFIERTGVLWMFRGDDHYARDCLPLLDQHGLRIEELSTAEAGRRFPQVNFAGVESCFLEPDAGMIYARFAAQTVRDRFVAAGGTYRVAHVTVEETGGPNLRSVRVADDESLASDQFVFACGAWLPETFPGLLSGEIVATREEVMYFGVPPGCEDFNGGKLPVWIDMGPPIIYGFPGGGDRGFKIGDDTRGPVMDPTADVRVVSEQAVARAREYLAHRFPALADAPLLETRVCQYENSRDGHYIIDRHPDYQNVWICGGGSGHGYKMGPAIGELMGRQIMGDATVAHEFRVNRRSSASGRVTQFGRR